MSEAPRDPEELEASAAAFSSEISPRTTMGPVRLSVSDLGRALDYYTREIGLTIRRNEAGSATLGAGSRDLLVLDEMPGARGPAGFTGLYHFALLLPLRTDLARWLTHAARDGVRVGGASDHFVSEALYLSDPDGHGIEIYWDRPRSHWEGQVASRITSLPLDIPDILRELTKPPTEPYEGMPDGTRMGHVHLKVATIPETVAFYADTIGFGLMARMGDQAAFLAAGGYHHHLGANTWESAGARPAPRGTAALQHLTIVVPDVEERDRVVERARNANHDVEDSDAGPLLRDPSGNRVLVAVS